MICTERNIKMIYAVSNIHGNYEKFKALAGNKYFKSVWLESIEGLPFEDVEFKVYIGTEYDGMTVELRSYNERIDKLRREEMVVVEDGWATFTRIGKPYVILLPLDQ